ERKVAVITGASQGIGAGLVRGFLDRGYLVVANSRSIQPDASADQITIAGDIADPAVAERVIGGAVEKFGRVDTLVNNAGMFIAKPFTEYTEADFAAKISLNLAGFFHVSQRAVRQMLAQAGGHIVNVTTTLVGQPLKGVPSALASLTKGGLDAVTRSLAIEYADKGPCQRGGPRCHQDADARARDTRLPRRAAPAAADGRDPGGGRSGSLPGVGRVRDRGNPARGRGCPRRSLVTIEPLFFSSQRT